MAASPDQSTGGLAARASGGSLLRQLRRYPAVDYTRYLRFLVAGQHVGWVRRDFAPHLTPFGKIFQQDDRAIALLPALRDYDSRSAAMAEVLAALREQGRVPGWRDEFYPVGRDFHLPPLLQMERAATPLFGVISYGVNVNGLVRRPDGLHVWIGRRSPHKQVDPNMLDLLAGGGQPLGISVWDNLQKECAEEAGVPAALARRAKPVGVITLQVEASEGLRVGLQFNYDLDLPTDFVPRNTDGEVAGFTLVRATDLVDQLRQADDFMYDIALVKIDLLIRHGLIGPDDPDYLALLAGLRRPLEFDPL
jgi:8-oxo-dGTP pyrophosphatase MutT (NUDIX family)